MEIRFHKNFKKRLKKLPSNVKIQFGERLEIFMHDKFAKILNHHAVDKAYPDCYSINVNGDYRAIFKNQDQIIIFMLIGTHAELY